MLGDCQSTYAPGVGPFRGSCGRAVRGRSRSRRGWRETGGDNPGRPWRGRPVVADYPSDALPPILPAPPRSWLAWRGGRRRSGEGSALLRALQPGRHRQDHPGVDGTGFRARHAPRAGRSSWRSPSRPPAEDRRSERTVAAARFLADRAVRPRDRRRRRRTGRLEEQAALVNQDAGAEVVRLVGPLVDPRPAYAAADVVVGLATSVFWEWPSAVRRSCSAGRAHRWWPSRPTVPSWKATAGSPRGRLHRPRSWPAALLPTRRLDPFGGAGRLGAAVAGLAGLARACRPTGAEVYSSCSGSRQAGRQIAPDVARCWSRLGVARVVDALRRARGRFSERRSTWPGGGGR